MVTAGLEGVVAAATQLSHVDGERGELIIAGYRVDDLAANATFEETTWLLLHGALPTGQQLEQFRAALVQARQLPPAIVALLEASARRRVEPMDALRLAAGAISLAGAAPADIVARLPVIVATYWRLLHGQRPLAPRSDLGHAANFLYMLDGEPCRTPSRCAAWRRISTR